MSIISAGTLLTNALTHTADRTGRLVFQTNGSTTALTLDSAQNASFTGDLTVAGNLTIAGTTTSFGDNDKIVLGDGEDLQLFHDGSNSYIKDNGTGQLVLDGNAVVLQYATSTKLTTTTTGIDVTGTAEVDGLSINGTAITATGAELNYVDGVTSAIQTQLDAKMTPTYTGDVNITGELIADSYNETYSALTAAATVDVDCETGNFFSLTTDQNTTFTFSNPPSAGTGYGFILEITQGGAYTVTFPAAVAWAGGAAPDAPASGETAVYVFITRDGGTTWYGFQGGTALA